MLALFGSAKAAPGTLVMTVVREADQAPVGKAAAPWVS